MDLQNLTCSAHIEDLPPKDQLYTVRERSGLNYSDVEIPLIRPPQDIPSETAEYRPATRNRIFAIKQPPSGTNRAGTNALVLKNSLTRLLTLPLRPASAS